MTTLPQQRPWWNRAGDQLAAWRMRGNLGRNPMFVAGVVVLGLFALLALARPVLDATLFDGGGGIYDPLVGYDRTIDHPSGPSARHLLGTDTFGRDVLALLVAATSATVAIAVGAALVTGILALALGTVMAFWRGRVDQVLSHVADAVVLLPAPLVMIVFAFARPDLFTPWRFGVIYGLLSGVGAGAIVVRSYGLTVINKPFIDAARVAGGSPWRLMSRHMLPHLAPLAAIQTMLAATGAIVAAAFVDFLTPGGTGEPTYGTLVYSGLSAQQQIADQPAWSALLAGSLAISLLAAAFYLLSVGLRQQVDPTTRDSWTSGGGV
ncbi:MAG: ABC transporter permease subunit [Nitriliruptorales bacterium]|nr:ABC transporter permease subunit [Nitriliruptorales bacterium]